MRLKLWQQVNLSLLFPVVIASAIVFFEFRNLTTVYSKIHVIEIIDDINLAILELRRYEKNILLFQEEQNVTLFYQYLDLLKKKVQEMEVEILSEMSRLKYKSLQDNIRRYEGFARDIIAGAKVEQELLKEIRPLGRIIEKNAANKELALELRRHEKNYIIYKEERALQKMDETVKSLLTMQSSLGTPIGQYRKSFDLLVKNELLKAESGDSIRYSAREIQKTVVDLSEKKRKDIDGLFSHARKSFIASFIFLLAAAAFAGLKISTKIVKTLKTMSEAVKNMAKGDFTYVQGVSAPEEIATFVKAFNCTARRLEEANVELELTLERLEDTNRELVERQEELVEARKLTAMRLLASEIAHEVNNPLSTLITYIGLFHEEMKEAGPKKESLSFMVNELSFMMNEAIRCQAILNELVDFARKEPLRLKEVDPSKLIREAIGIVSRQYQRGRVQLEASLEDLPEKSVLDPVLFYQALVNVLTNAFQHTTEGGRIAIQGRTDRNMMNIVISDSGTGIPDDVLSHIFDPFFSTRKEDGGNGLGLAITKKIIERHNGSIRVSSKLGEGTVFQIDLPVRVGESW